MFKINPLYNTDGYKVGHKAMLAPGTTKLYGTWIPRSTKHAPKGVTKIVSFGQQLTWKYIHDVFEEYFFKKEWVDARKFVSDMQMYLGMEYDGSHFEELYKLGYLPLKVKSLPEGIETNPNIPHMTFINTVDGFAWLTLYMETMVSNLAWKPSTAATIAKLYRRQAEKWVAKTDKDNMWLVDYMCHDFSARGLSGPDDMISVGLGHATSFRGSDTLAAIPAARYYYGEPDNEVIINSVNASEHSVSTTKIFTVGEQQMIADWLELFPKGILSIVADTFDLWKLITEYLPANKDAIMARDGKLVIRPDSGNPVDIICGYNIKTIECETYEQFLEECQEELHEILVDETPHGEYGGDITSKYYWNKNLYQVTYSPDWNRYDKQYYYIDNYGKEHTKAVKLETKPSDKGVIELLWDIFGGIINEQGYKVLDPHIGAIYGDSITPERQVQIYERLAAKGFAATNIVLGVGSFTYQYNTRDTLGFAAKGAWFELDEECTCADNIEDCVCTKTYNIYKDPVTDDGTKKSLKGLLQVYQTHKMDDRSGIPNYEVEQECTPEEESEGLLQTIYEDGKFYNTTNFKEVRERLNKI